MSEIEVRIPKSLGLSEEKRKQLEERFHNDFVDTIAGSPDAQAKRQAASQDEIVAVPIVQVQVV